MSTATIYAKLQRLPKDLQSEVADYIDFLFEKKVSSSYKRPIPGLAEGKLTLNSDFDDPLPEMESYMK